MQRTCQTAGAGIIYAYAFQFEHFFIVSWRYALSEIHHYVNLGYGTIQIDAARHCLSFNRSDVCFAPHRERTVGKRPNAGECIFQVVQDRGFRNRALFEAVYIFNQFIAVLQPFQVGENNDCQFIHFDLFRIDCSHQRIVAEHACNELSYVIAVRLAEHQRIHIFDAAFAFSRSFIRTVD